MDGLDLTKKASPPRAPCSANNNDDDEDDDDDGEDDDNNDDDDESNVPVTCSKLGQGLYEEKLLGAKKSFLTMKILPLSLLPPFFIYTDPHFILLEYVFTEICRWKS